MVSSSSTGGSISQRSAISAGFGIRFWLPTFSRRALEKNSSSSGSSEPKASPNSSLVSRVALQVDELGNNLWNALKTFPHSCISVRIAIRHPGGRKPLGSSLPVAKKSRLASSLMSASPMSFSCSMTLLSACKFCAEILACSGSVKPYCTGPMPQSA